MRQYLALLRLQLLSRYADLKPKNFKNLDAKQRKQSLGRMALYAFLVLYLGGVLVFVEKKAIGLLMKMGQPPRGLADLLVIAPATANMIAKLRWGLADDMLSTTMLAAWKKPRIVCPAMNTDMYENPVTQRNLKTLAELGFTFVEPKADMLACGVVGKGALANIPDILDAVRAAGLGAGEQA